MKGYIDNMEMCETKYTYIVYTPLILLTIVGSRYIQSIENMERRIMTIERNTNKI